MLDRTKASKMLALQGFQNFLISNFRQVTAYNRTSSELLRSVILLKKVRLLLLKKWTEAKWIRYSGKDKSQLLGIMQKKVAQVLSGILSG
jgi:hypothetical protein